MKRWTLRISLMLILGVVTTVGVAWGLAVGPRPNLEGGKLVFTATTPVWYGGYYAQAGAREIHWFPLWLNPERSVDLVEKELRAGAEVIDPSFWSRVNAFDATFLEDNWFSEDLLVVDESYGWPGYALEFSFSIEPDRSDDSLWTLHHGAWNIAEGLYLPVRPIFPGFIINTVLYAAIWFVLIFGWRAHLRLVRRWQGYCPMCKYDVRGDMEQGCPECGWGREC